MSVWEIVFIGAALAMDAVAVGMAGGMAEPRMSTAKAVVTALTFALFQFGMPLLGYACGAAFAEVVARIAPFLSFALLLLIGGKMLVDGIREEAERARGRLLRPMLRVREGGGRSRYAAKLLAQGVATSLDALAVGVTLLAAQMSGGLPAHIAACAAVIGAVTFALSFGAVQLGRRAGRGASGAAGGFGGMVLIVIGVKLLAEGLA